MRLIQALKPRARLARALFATLLTSALFLFPAASPHTTQAVGQLVTTQNLSNTPKNSEAPQIATGGGRLSAVWAERDTKTTGAFGFTSTTIDASFPGASIQNTGSFATYQWADVAVDSDGTSHIDYSAGIDNGTVSYQRQTAGGGKSTVKIASGYSLPNATKIARGPNGALWALWRDASGGLLYKYSTNNGDSWINGSDGGVIPNGSGTVLTMDIAVDQSNVPHIVWYNNSGTNKGQIRYADWNGSSFVTSDLTTDSFYDADPVITADANNILHVVWRKQLSGPPNEQWAIYHASRPVGGLFGNFEAIATTANPGFAPAVGSDTAGNLYVTYSELQANSNRHILLLAKLTGQNWQGPLDLKVAGRRFDSRSAVTGTTETGAEAHVLIQSELGSDDAEIYYKRVQFGPVASPLSAQPSIENGAATTNKSAVLVSFSNLQGSPTEIRWRWGAAPTDIANDSGGWQTFTNPKAIPLPTGVSSCATLTLFTQVKDGTTVESSAKSDAIRFDNSVQANVRIVNPFLASLPQTFTQISDVGASNSDGAYDGDPGYTRIPQFFLGINDAGDCSNLVSFTVPASNFSGSITGGQYQNKVTVPQAVNTNPGSSQTIGVSVIDGASNIGNYSASLIYDPANTDTTGTSPNTTGLPVLHSGDVNANSGNSIIRTLSFNNVNVTDNVYGIKENLPSGRQFWGVWIANSRTGNLGVHDPSLIWSPVQVPSPNSSFTVPWNIFTGLGIGPDRSQTGDYYLYVRFLDGAGNATNTMLTPLKVTLTAGYTIPTVHLPLVRR